MSKEVPPFIDIFAMNDLPKHFFRTLALHEEKDVPWELLKEEIPILSRGWFELSRLTLADRIEFTRDFWLAKLGPTMPPDWEGERVLLSFFDHLDELGIYATQQREYDPFEIHMVYGLKGGEGFFHGTPGASKETLTSLCRQFEQISFPEEYLAFLEIHDGFSKYTDTGIIKTHYLSRTYIQFQRILEGDIVITPEGDVLNPEHLFPFYEASELHDYQCFCSDWYPEGRIGNMHFSERHKTLNSFSMIYHLQGQQAFPSFLHWLLFYLEDLSS